MLLILINDTNLKSWKLASKINPGFPGVSEVLVIINEYNIVMIVNLPVHNRNN
jgi:hypothetical protein